MRKLAEHRPNEHRAELQELAEEYFGVERGDSVVYVGPDPSRFTAGVVVEVRRAFGRGSHGSVWIQPWNKNGFGNKLTKADHLRRVFTDRSHFRVVRRRVFPENFSVRAASALES